MPIKFFCESCGKKVSVPDGVTARQGHCPRCRAKLTIPDASLLAPPKVSPARLPENPLNEYEDILLDIDRAEADRLPGFASSAPLASVPSLAQPPPQETVDEPPIPLSAVPSAPSVVKFNCAKCGQRIGVSADLIGQSGVCPRCGETVTAVALPPSPDMTAQMLRPSSRTPTQYGFKALTEAERHRIQEEERVRALARVRATEEAQQLVPVRPMPVSAPRGASRRRIRRFIQVGRQSPVIGVLITICVFAGVVVLLLRSERLSGPPVPVGSQSPRPQPDQASQPPPDAPRESGRFFVWNPGDRQSVDALLNELLLNSVEAEPDNSIPGFRPLKWDCPVDVDLLAYWHEPERPVEWVDHRGGSSEYYLVEHKDNPAVKGWIYPRYLWFGPVRCESCGDDMNIREPGWCPGDNVNHPVTCQKCGAVLPRVALPVLPNRVPPFVKLR